MEINAQELKELLQREYERGFADGRRDANTQTWTGTGIPPADCPVYPYITTPKPIDVWYGSDTLTAPITPTFNVTTFW